MRIGRLNNSFGIGSLCSIRQRNSALSQRIRKSPARSRVCRPFQTDGQFDSGKYKTFVLEQLGPRGFTELQLENLIRDALRFERVKAIVSAPVAVSEAEILDAARL